MAEAPRTVPEDFCDLPPVPGLPGLAGQAMREHMAGADGTAAIETLERRWRQRGLQEGDEA